MENTYPIFDVTTDYIRNVYAEARGSRPGLSDGMAAAIAREAAEAARARLDVSFGDELRGVIDEAVDEVVRGYVDGR